MSLRLKLILGYVLIVAASFTFALHLIKSEVRPRYLEAVEESTVDTAELLAAVLSQQIKDGRLELASIDEAMRSLATRRFYARIYNAEKTRVSLRVLITDKQGVLLYDSWSEQAPGTDFSQWRDVYLTLRGEYGARSTRTDPDNPASSVIYVAAPIISEGTLIGVVTVGKPQDSVTLFIDIAQKKLFLALSLIGCLAVLIAVALSVWVTSPIKRLTGYVRSVRQGGTTAPPRLGSPEVDLLGQAVVEMQNKLDGKNYIEDYVRALTHEMKSPLTGIKGAGEILREHVIDPRGRKFLGHIENEAARMQSLVERMLQLSRLENVRTISKKTFSALELFDGLNDSLQSRLETKAVSLEYAIERDQAIFGDAFLLRQTLENLIANALDFSPSGSTIRVRLGLEQGMLRMIIRDQGCGIPAFALDKVFDKFFSLPRPGSGKKSTGLGLPFVREVVLLHNGGISLRNTHPGLEVTVTLPTG